MSTRSFRPDAEAAKDDLPGEPNGMEDFIPDFDKHTVMPFGWTFATRLEPPRI